MKPAADPPIDLKAPRPGCNDGKGRLETIRQSVPGGYRMVWRCTCGGCGHVDEAVHNTHDQTIVTANLKRRGWRGFGKRIRCPACVAAPHRSAVCSQAPATALPPQEPERSTIMCSATAPADLINAARVGQYLEIYWQDSAGRYDDGWDDGRIGKELGGIAPDFVRRVREGLGKVPKRPAEIVEAERRLAALEGEVSARLQGLKDVAALWGAELECCRKLIAQADAKAGVA